MTAKIISLTSIPPRFAELGQTLRTLTSQTADVDEIRLYLPRRYRRFPDSAIALPDLPSGIRVIYVDEDLGPASKVLFAARDLQDRDCQILFCDDDRYYHPTWAETLFAYQRERPKECVAAIGDHLDEFVAPSRKPARLPRAVVSHHGFDPGYRLDRVKHLLTGGLTQSRSPKPMRRPVQSAGYVDILSGCAGAVVRPSFFSSDAFEIPRHVWMVDDIWLSGQLEARGIPIWVPERQYLASRSANDRIEALYDANLAGLDRNAANVNAIRYLQSKHGIWI
ncbi:glycosyltransferase [Thalassococcus sp. S3]|uniref:glycosyltransferase n=1 Tax=Thalassococcus sp. S3 TaxID=2017482 RepID=UPI0010245750|nr:glycosyltransferase [Thalassococcus sp. S3]QBF33373.1 glycosyltransferase [Thalassococcus sp. S3]